MAILMVVPLAVPMASYSYGYSYGCAYGYSYGYCYGGFMPSKLSAIPKVLEFPGAKGHGNKSWFPQNILGRRTSIIFLPKDSGINHVQIIKLIMFG